MQSLPPASATARRLSRSRWPRKRIHGGWHGNPRGARSPSTAMATPWPGRHTTRARRAWRRSHRPATHRAQFAGRLRDGEGTGRAMHSIQHHMRIPGELAGSATARVQRQTPGRRGADQNPATLGVIQKTHGCRVHGRLGSVRRMQAPENFRRTGRNMDMVQSLSGGT